MIRCNTVNDWMNEVASALRDGDKDALRQLENISQGWLQGSEERGAQYNLIEACLESMDTY